MIARNLKLSDTDIFFNSQLIKVRKESVKASATVTETNNLSKFLRMQKLHPHLI